MDREDQPPETGLHQHPELCLRILAAVRSIVTKTSASSGVSTILASSLSCTPFVLTAELDRGSISSHEKSVMNERKAFVSHSHSDKVIAERLAQALHDQGIEAWLDKWEIRPGDSLVQKVFEEGLKECSAFLVLLSRHSVVSNWVKHELDVAMLRRLQGTVRVVPVVVEDCEIPHALRPLLWVDLAKDFDAGARRIADVIVGRSDKPSVQPEPSRLKVSVPGLTQNAARLAVFLSASLDSPEGRPPGFKGSDLAKELDLPAEQINDVAEELESQHIVRLDRALFTAPFTFVVLRATYFLAHQLRGTGVLEYDPEEDVLSVAAAVVAMGNASGPSLLEKTGLTTSRLNNAVTYLDDNGLLRVSEEIARPPFSFSWVQATSSTRRFVAQNAR